jgi:hypothetical protein
VNGFQQGFRSEASFGFGGQESASKPPQSHMQTVRRRKNTQQIVENESLFNTLNAENLIS